MFFQQKSAFTRMMIFARGSQGSRVAVLLTNTIMNHRTECLKSRQSRCDVTMEMSYAFCMLFISGEQWLANLNTIVIGKM
ncbi:hypothetical protein T4B_12567 [Trichinella pseudospiralis]|uniref:Uncharacterized protein n=1 Tax=Trichinella pseudospiralis TaxID=6337 RepID=A0A0V1JIA6_TRIPS|nr:hypothetical protein T4B_12567 [Trichinella pseudospiralis]